MKGIGAVFLIAVLTIGAFTSIPNVDAIDEYGNLDFTKAKGVSQPGYGSALGKVCGLELCGSKSMPVEITNATKTVIIDTNNANKALERALSGGAAAEIIAEYNSYKGVDIVTQTNNSTDNIGFNNFANPDFLNQKATPTVMKTEVEQEEFAIELPSYMKKSYANPDYPVYTPKIKQMPIIENVASIEIEKDVLHSSNMTDAEADMILFNLGFDIDMSKVGICGPGTELVHGMCLIDGQVPESVNIDWADYWDTKEEKEIILEQVVMTNGTEAIPVVEDIHMNEMSGGADEEPVEEPEEIIDESVEIPSFEESVLSSNATNIDIESIPEPVIPEPMEKVVEELSIIEEPVVEELDTNGLSVEEIEAMALESENNSRYSEAAGYYADAASIYNDNGNYQKAFTLYSMAAGHLENAGNNAGAAEYRQMAADSQNMIN